jgi:hypothetical protein
LLSAYTPCRTAPRPDTRTQLPHWLAGAYHAILAADSLLPDGSGQALTRDEVSLLWDVEQALGQALDRAAATRRWEGSKAVVYSVHQCAGAC